MGKKGESDLNKDASQTCRCYMQILSVENMEGAIGWHLSDVSNLSYGQEPNFCVDGSYDEGVGPKWKWCENTQSFSYDFPTPFRELNPPSNGQHMFYAGLPFSNSIIHTKVNCYLGDEGDQELARSYDVDFSPSAGNPEGWIFYSFVEDFSCFYEPDLPDPTPGTSDY